MHLIKKWMIHQLTHEAYGSCSRIILVGTSGRLAGAGHLVDYLLFIMVNLLSAGICIPSYGEAKRNSEC